MTDSDQQKAHDILFMCDVDDSEHVIRDHASQLPEYYRALCKQVQEARKLILKANRFEQHYPEDDNDPEY